MHYGAYRGIRSNAMFKSGWGAGAPGAILFFLQEPEHFKKLEWS